MRKIRLLLLLILCLTGIKMTNAQERMFDEISKMEGVRSVYLSRAAIKMGAMTPSFKLHGTDYKVFVDNLEFMEVITCEDATIIPQALAVCKKILKNPNWETIMEVVQDDVIANIYANGANGEDPADETKVRDLLIEVTEKNELTIVYMRGKIDLSMLTMTL